MQPQPAVGRTQLRLARSPTAVRWLALPTQPAQRAAPSRQPGLRRCRLCRFTLHFTSLHSSLFTLHSAASHEVLPPTPRSRVLPQCADPFGGHDAAQQQATRWGPPEQAPRRPVLQVASTAPRRAPPDVSESACVVAFRSCECSGAVLVCQTSQRHAACARPLRRRGAVQAEPGVHLCGAARGGAGAHGGRDGSCGGALGPGHEAAVRCRVLVVSS